MTKRQAVYAGVNDSLNVPTSWYDALNRPTTWENTRAGDAWFSTSHYQYDKAGREVATWRDENNGSGPKKGERFFYYTTNQLYAAEYNADEVWTGNPSNWGGEQGSVCESGVGKGLAGVGKGSGGSERGQSSTSSTFLDWSNSV